MISWIGVDMSEPGVAAGVVFAVAAGASWALYMWMGSKVATAGVGPDSLAIGMAIGAIVYIPLAIPSFGAIVTDPKMLALMVAVGVFSSVVPYFLEVTILTRVPASLFALLNSLYPATSLVVGMVLLRQFPSAGEIGGLVLISIAVVLVTWRPRKARIPRA